MTGASQLALRFDSDPCQLGAVRREVESACRRHGFSAEASDQVGLCLNEALANIMRHAYSGANDRPIELTARFNDTELRLTIRDWGCGTDPSRQPREADDLLQPGGLGLMILAKWMDRVQFHPQPDGMILELTRNRSTVG